MYVAAAYLIAYFFLTFFLTLILATSNTETKDCQLGIRTWYIMSTVLYFSAFILTAAILFKIRRVHLDEDLVVLRHFVLIYHNVKYNWLFITLLIIDLMNVILTIEGSILTFNDVEPLFVCYLEIPMLANFMFILVILGYIYFLRMIVTIVHFWFGVRIYSWIK